MADRKISDLTALTAPASGDYVPIVDISEGAAASKNKRVTIQSLFQGIPVNVGIGTSSPATALDVSSGTSGTAAAIKIQDPAGRVLQIASPSASTEAYIGTTTNHRLDFYTNNAVKATLDSSGRVGIGTSSPQSRLDLGAGSTGATQISWHDSSTTSYGNIWQSFNGARTTIANGLKGSTTVVNGFESSTSNLWGRAAAELNYGVIQFYTDAASTVAYGTAITPTERLRIDSSGRVGIGTTSPTTLLDVNADTVRVRTARTPASASATGATGEICWDASYIYVAVGTNTWKRSALSTW